MENKETTKKVTTLKDFLNKEFLGYSVYKIIQQLPNFYDTLGQTSRKELYLLLKSNKKIKTAEIYTMIYNDTKYSHGDSSAFRVFETMAASFKNNVNLIDPKGSFGYRTNQVPSSPRYTSGKISKLAHALFSKIDDNIHEVQIFEGAEIEPLYLTPILPVNVVNGFNGIAVGYSANIIPRDPLYIANLIKGILIGKIKTIPKYLPVKYPYFNGDIQRGDNDKQFIFTGRIKKAKSTKKYGTLIIDEVPPGYDRAKVVDILNSLIEDNVVVDWSDNCVKNTFYFEVKVPVEIYNLDGSKLLSIFKLVTKMSETLVFFKNSEIEGKEIIEYNSIAEYLHDWILSRLKLYKKRKNFILDKIKYDINILENKVRFIQGIIDKEIIIEKKKKSVIEKTLEKMKFFKIDDKYDYLLNMSLWSLTEERIKDAKAKIRELKKQYSELEKTDHKDLWINDLNNLIPLIEQEMKEK